MRVRKKKNLAPSTRENGQATLTVPPRKQGMPWLDSAPSPEYTTLQPLWKPLGQTCQLKALGGVSCVASMTAFQTEYSSRPSTGAPEVPEATAAGGDYNNRPD